MSNEMMRRYAQKLSVMCRFGDQLKELATDDRVKVGAILFPVDCRAVFGIGYNGAASGLPHDSIRKEGVIGGGYSGAAHAEMNCLSKCGEHREPMILYTTLEPCRACAPVIVNNPWIIGVIVDQRLKGPQSSMDILTGAGMPVVHRLTIHTLSSIERHALSKEEVDIIAAWRNLRITRREILEGGGS